MTQEQTKQVQSAHAARWRRGAIELAAIALVVATLVVGWNALGGPERWPLSPALLARDATSLMVGMAGLMAFAWLRWAELRAEVARRERAETHLAESIARARDLVHHLHSAVLILAPQEGDQGALILDLNPAAERLVGRPRETLVGHPLPQAFPGLVTPSLAELRALWLQEGRAHIPDVHYADNRGGEVVNVWLDLHIFTLPGGEVVVVFEDITRRHDAQAAAQQLQAMVQQMSEAVVLTDARARILYVNQAACRLHGYVGADEVLGQDAVALHARRNPDGQATEALMRLYMEACQPFEIEYEDHRADGRAFVARLAASRLSIAGQPEPCWVALLSDVTDKRELEQRLRQVAKMEAVGRLSGGIAHDFNNLLTVISGYTQMALSQVPKGDPLAADLRAVAEAGERATRLTRQLLAFSRRQILQLRAVDLNKVVEGLLPMLASILGESVDLVLDLAPDLNHVEADASQIEQVILNLVVNACDAMPCGGRLTLRTANIIMDEPFVQTHRGARPGRYAALHVQDTGVGMTPEVQAHLFEPFFTTKQAGQGTGLGLATSYGIIKQSKGFLYAESGPGQGATFSIYLPLASAPAEAMASHASTPGVPQGTEMILVVEDDAVVRSLTTEFLQQLGYTVIAAAGAEEAMMLFGEHRLKIALMLTDVVMPVLCGNELAARLRALRPDLPVLYMTGYSDAALQERGALAPDMDIVRKPFDMSSLACRVRQALDRAPLPTPTPGR
jgi:PAS domain S-box-containing protein